MLIKFSLFSLKEKVYHDKKIYISDFVKGIVHPENKILSST